MHYTISIPTDAKKKEDLKIQKLYGIPDPLSQYRSGGVLPNIVLASVSGRNKKAKQFKESLVIRPFDMAGEKNMRGEYFEVEITPQPQGRFVLTARTNLISAPASWQKLTPLLWKRSLILFPHVISLIEETYSKENSVDHTPIFDPVKDEGKMAMGGLYFMLTH